MKKIFLLFVSFFFSCKKETYQLKTDEIFISKNVRFQENGDFLTLKSGKFTYKIPHSKLPYKKIMLLNASLVGYITELGAEEKIIGVSSPEYIFSDKIHQLIKENKIQNIGNEQKYDVEKILHKPDAIFTNYVASFENTYDVLKKMVSKSFF
jgi:iron complex transport system substrate-binding protein